MIKIFKVTGILIGALVVTSLGIDASQTWQGSSGTLIAGLIGSQETGCGEGMVAVPAGRTFSCVDQYEASAGPGCTVAVPNNPADTEANVANEDCGAVSQQGVLPWRYVSRARAAQLCARAGKRLPSAAEWYDSALDTKTSDCQVSTGVINVTGKNVACVSAAGVYDAVGNVWEWVEDDVMLGQYRGRPVPPSGYVTSADADGVATMTGSAAPPGSPYDTAYFWSDSQGTFGMIRGGFYGSRGDAGVYAVHAHTPPEFTGEAVGFRCVR